MGKKNNKSCFQNIVLDIVLVIVFHMGVAGVSIATIFSQGVSASAMVSCGVCISSSIQGAIRIPRTVMKILPMIENA